MSAAQKKGPGKGKGTFNKMLTQGLSSAREQLVAGSEETPALPWWEECHLSEGGTDSGGKEGRPGHGDGWGFT